MRSTAIELALLFKCDPWVFLNRSGSEVIGIWNDTQRVLADMDRRDDV